MLSADRIQAQLQASAQAFHTVVPCAPFTCYFHPDDPAPYANYAMPDKPLDGASTPTLDALVECFKQHGRTPKLEYIQDFAPRLAPALEAYGFELDDRNLLMACTVETRRRAPRVDGLKIVQLDDDGPLVSVQEFNTVQGRAFGGDDRPAATAAESRRFRERMRGLTLFLARLDGVAAGAGSMTLVHDGIAEVAGISTLTPFRRQGIAAALSDHITAAGFERGLSALFLTAADEDAGRIYGRVGYQAIGYSLSYTLGRHPD